MEWLRCLKDFPKFSPSNSLTRSTVLRVIVQEGGRKLSRRGCEEGFEISGINVNIFNAQEDIMSVLLCKVDVEGFYY